MDVTPILEASGGWHCGIVECLPGSDSHPTDEQLMLLARQHLQGHLRQRLATHLAWCVTCDDRIARLPAAHVELGRPVPPVLPVLPDEAEDAIGTFVALCMARLSKRPAHLVISGNGWSERKLSWTLSVAASRLRRTGLSVAVRGQAYTSAVPPVLPASDVVYLLEAPVYSELRAAEYSGLLVQVGHEDDWKARGVEPEWMVRVRSPAEARRRLGPACEVAQRQLTGPDQRGRVAALLNAHAMDVPLGFFPDSSLSPFIPVHDVDGDPTRWTSIEAGQWLTREMLAEVRTGPLLRDAEEQIADVVRQLAGDEGKRLESRWRAVMRLRGKTL